MKSSVRLFKRARPALGTVLEISLSGLSEEQISETVSQLRSSVAGIPNLFEPILIGPLPQVSDSLAEVLGRERICSTSFSFEDYTGRLRERRTV